MIRALSTICLALLLAATPSTAASSEPPEDFPDPGITRLGASPVVIEMNLDSGRPMVGLMVDGKGPFQFVVDTGAGLSVIDQGIAEELGLEVVGTQVLHSPGASEDIEGNRVQVGRLEVGQLRIDKPVLATMDLVGFSAGTIQGVLGRPHFEEFLLTFDYPASQLVVARGSLDSSDPGVLAFDAGAGSVRFPLDVAGVRLPVVLDTGSPGGFTLPKALESRFKFHSALQQGPTIRLVGGVHQAWSATLDGTVRLGEVSYDDPEVVLTTFAEDFGNIGFGVLRDLRVTLDQENALVRFERKVAAEPRVAHQGGPQVRRVVRQGGPVALGGPSSGQPRIGVGFEMTPSGFVKRDGGLIVRHVDAGSPGERAGLTVGDIVLSVGGTALADIDGVMAIAGLMKAARPLEMELLRGAERLTIAID